MPVVNGKHYPYTDAGMKAAAAARQKTTKAASGARERMPMRPADKMPMKSAAKPKPLPRAEMPMKKMPSAKQMPMKMMANGGSVKSTGGKGRGRK